MTAGPPHPGPRASEIQGTGGAGVHLLREPPLGQSILWHPTSPTVVQRKPPVGPYTVFFDQKAIIAVNAHYETAGRQGMMGFLVGDLCESPTTHQRFVVIDSTIRLNQAVYGDKTLVIVSRLWDRIQEELKKTEGHLIGWYHSHPPITVELAPGDVETHLQYFKRPWHVALVLASEHEGAVAGLFRPKPGETAASTSMPFYELIEEGDEGATLATKQSVLPWINYLTDDKAAKYASGDLPETATPPPSASALQVVKPASPTPKPAPAIPTSPSGKVSAVKPAATTATPRPAPAVPAPPAATQLKPPAPAAPLAPAATAQPRPPAAVTSTTGTTARPALEDRPQPPQPSQPSQPPAPPQPSAPAQPARRDTQMKSPINALSNLPIVEAGGYHLGDVDARASEPGVVRPRSRETQAALPRRPAIVPKPFTAKSSTPRPFAPALAPRGSDGHPGLVAFFVLALLGGGVFAGWKYWWVPNHPATAAASGPSADSARTARPSSASKSVAGGATPATSNPPPTTVVDSPYVTLDRNADSVIAGVVGYGALVQSGRTGCDALSPALVAVEDAWKRYNVGKKKLPSLDGDRFLRDQRLVASVDSVEGDFDRSGCTRP